MMRASLQRLRQLPAATRVFCAHEYTTANLAFAVAADPDNSALQGRVKTRQDLRAQNQPTVPSTIGEEIATNPFLRWDAQSLTAHLARAGGETKADPDAVFAQLRQWKDNF